ncbi:hypothetical protein EV2_017756 [Malus domestica]
MEGSDETGGAKQHRLNPAFGSSSFLVPGIPPSHPNNHNSMPFSRPQSGSWQMGQHNLSSRSSHTRSMSQPPLF